MSKGVAVGHCPLSNVAFFLLRLFFVCLDVCLHPLHHWHLLHPFPFPFSLPLVPIGLADRDLMACAQTGSGKTAGFLFPCIIKLLREGPLVRTNTNHCAPSCPSHTQLPPLTLSPPPTPPHPLGGTRRPRQWQVRQSIPLLFDFVPDKRIGHSDPRRGTQIHVQHRSSTVLHLRWGGRPQPIAGFGKGLRHLDRDTGTFDRFCGTRPSQHGDHSHSDHGRSRPHVGTCLRYSLRALLFVLVASPSTTHNGLKPLFCRCCWGTLLTNLFFGFFGPLLLFSFFSFYFSRCYRIWVLNPKFDASWTRKTCPAPGTRVESDKRSCSVRRSPKKFSRWRETF